MLVTKNMFPSLCLNILQDAVRWHHSYELWRVLDQGQGHIQQQCEGQSNVGNAFFSLNETKYQTRLWHYVSTKVNQHHV